MKRGLQFTLAVLTGYILGRRRKLRMALLLGAAAAAGRYGGNPTDLLARGRGLVGGSSPLGELSGLARPLVEAGRAAARTAVTDRIDRVSDRLRDRSDALRAAARPAAGETVGAVGETVGETVGAAGEAVGAVGEEVAGLAPRRRAPERPTRRRRGEPSEHGEEFAERGARGREATEEPAYEEPEYEAEYEEAAYEEPGYEEPGYEQPEEESRYEEAEYEEPAEAEPTEPAEAEPTEEEPMGREPTRAGGRGPRSREAEAPVRRRTTAVRR